MQKGDLFTKKSFSLWILSSIYHSMVIYFAVLFLFDNDVLQSNGKVADLWVMGTVASTIAVTIVNLRMAIETK
jgi:phospholipid-transporting ATPase